jgi:A/G-specific adenine glycosylase
MTAGEARSIDPLAGLDVEAFRRAVLAWFDARGRSFPFRGTTDPYLVLVSETILQQTQISRGGPAWVRFTTQFPTLESLAEASPAAALRAWQGLGYNRRAINLQRAARIIVGELQGVFPRTIPGLERLPGVGPYTARAVASIAFQLPVGAVDTNVRRVIGRVLAGSPTALGPRLLQEAADELVDPTRPDDWTHALMDIGSTLCRPGRPLCPDCPVREMCRYAAGDRPVPARTRAAASRRRPGLDRSPSGFRQTTRWLRGRILDRLRDAPGDSWTAFGEPIGEHDVASIEASLRAMEGEGLLEREPSALEPAANGSSPRPVRARLPIA